MPSLVRKKRAEKLEEMIGYIYAHDHWLNVLRNIRVFGEEDNRELKPLPKAMAISAIYFPELSDEFAALDLTCSQYEVWMLAGAKKRLDGNIQGLTDGNEEAYRPYMQKREDLLSKLKVFAASEFVPNHSLWKRRK